MLNLYGPIYVNLSGDYVIPFDGKPPEVGSVSGDIRLAELDAFLHALRVAGSEEKTKSRFEQALSAVIRQCQEGRSIGQDGLSLTITSKLDPAQNEIAYTFSLK